MSYDALQRHLIAFWGGEDQDEETGQHHLSAVMWHATVLYEFTLDHPEYDDRSTAGRQEPEAEAVLDPQVPPA